MNRTYVSKIPSRGSGTSDYGELFSWSEVRKCLRRLGSYSLLLTLGILFQVNIASAQVGKAIDLNGSTDYVQAPAGVYFNGDFTVEGWVYQRTLNPNSRLLDFGGGASNNNVLFGYLGNGLLYFYIFNGASGQVVTSTATIPVSQWVHLAATLSGTTMTIYINGQAAGSGTIAAPTNVSRSLCYIAKSNFSNDPLFNGKIDEFRIWNVARTQAEIQATMNTALTGNEANLQLYYNMENVAAFGNGQTVPDVAATLSGAQNGTTVGSANTPTITTLNTWGNVLNFNGSTNWVNLGAPSLFNSFTNQITLESWIRPNSYPSGIGAAVLVKQNLSGFLWSLKFQGDGTFAFAALVNGNVIYCSIPQTQVPLNTWSHVAGTFDGSALRLYINGALVTTVAQAGSLSNSSAISTSIGATADFGEYFSGSIDEVRVWNVARTAAQIQNALYTTIAPSTAGLLSYYTFDQGTPNGNNAGQSTLIDVKNGINGTMNGFALNGNTSNWIARSPIVNTPSASAITTTSATIGANYVQSGTNALEERGMVWGTTNNVSLSAGTKAAISGTAAGAYSTAISNLTTGQKYYYKGYAYSNDGIGYTALDSFTTLACAIYPENIVVVPTPMGANVSWTTAFSATAYSWRVVESGLGVNGTATASGTTTTASAAVTGLVPSKNYDFYVLITAGNCTGTWSSARAFSTTLEWNNALHFDGVNDYVNLGTSNYFNGLAFANFLTVEAWVRPNAAFSGGFGNALIMKETNVGYDWGLRAYTNSINFFLRNSSGVVGNADISSSYVPVNQWTHLAATYDAIAGQMKLYVNGQLVTTTAHSGAMGLNAGVSVTVGAAQGVGRYFNGSIDEVRIWNVARTTAQIQAGMYGVSTASGVLCYLKMNDGIPNATNAGLTSATDATPYALNGTLVNFGLSGNTSNWIARAPFLQANAATSITNSSVTLNGNLLQVGTGTVLEKGFIWGTMGTTLSLNSGTKAIVSGASAGAFSTTISSLNANQAYVYCAYAITSDGYSLSSTTNFYSASEWNNALHFDGVNDLVDLGRPAALATTTNLLTVEAWVRPTAFPGVENGIVEKYEGGAGSCWGLRFNGTNTLTCFLKNASNSEVYITATPGVTFLNQWTHVAMTYDGSFVRLYANGALVGSTAQTGNIATTPVNISIGGAKNLPYFFQGQIDEVRIWGTARTQSEIQSGMIANIPTTTAGLIAYYPFDQGVANGTNTTVTTATDIKSGINGTLTNFALTGSTSNWVARAPYMNSTITVSAMTNTSTTLNSNLILAGTGTVLEKGFIWTNGATTPTFAAGTKVIVAGTATGAYSLSLTGLTLGQTYTARAYSVSADGYTYSSPLTFMLDPCATPPPLNTILVSNIGDTTATISWVSLAPSYDWLIAPSGLGIANPSFTGNSTTNSVALTNLEIGANYDVFLRGNCGATQSAWQGPVTFQTSSTASFTSSSAINDAYVQLNWILRPLPCLVNNGTPYSQGIYVKLTDQTTGQVLKQEPITDLAPFIGAQQPAFNYVAGDSANAKTCTIDNTNGWFAYGSSTWTIEAWVKGSINAANAEIFKAVAANTTIIKITGTVISVQKNGTTTNFSTPLPLGKWKHLAFTYNGGTVALFIDGEKKEEKNISSLLFTGASTIYSVANNFKNIQMGEIRYWNRVRTDVEIAYNRWSTSFNALGQNNLLLHLRWNTNNAAPVDLATAYDGQNNAVTYSGTGTLQTLPYITTPDYTSITGSFRHYVGPSKSKTYKLEVFQIGSGAAIPTCTNLTTSGSTIAFQQPINATATTTLLDRVRLQWTNKSKLSETFKIFRGGVLRSVIAGSDKIDSVFVWEDKYSTDDSLSIVNGTAYSYCIETYCNTLVSAYTPQTCRTGNTFNLNFAATDGSPSNKVNLSWANVASYNYNIQIKRDGALIATLPAATVTYADASPVYGKVAKYEIVLVNPTTGEIIVSKSDNGSVPARGSISGRAVTLNNNYAIKNVRIKLHSLVDTTVNLTTYTDYLGNFVFNNLYYNINGQFEVSADYGNHIFVEPLKTITLNDANFAVSNVDFLDSTGLTVSATPLAVSNFVGTSVANQDKINFAWTASLSAGDTVLYDIYREATRIATLTNLTNALSFTDLEGEPNVSYKYKLNAYKVQNGMISAVALTDTIVFPQVASTTGFAATANATLGVVNMTWSHASSNYDGFRVYRNGKKIAEIPTGTSSYTDADAKPGTSATYVLKSKRFVNNITFESLGQTVSNVNVPALPNVTGVTATANTSRNSILVSWTIPAALTATYNYDGFRVYRRLSSAAASTDVYIGQLPKGINPPFEDKNAIPSTPYTYTVKGYLRLSDNTLGESAGASANATCPVVTPVTALTASTTLAGEVALAWTAPASTVRNLDGIAVLRGTDTLAILPYNANTYRVFTNSTTSTAYSVRVFRNVAGVRRFSATLSSSGKAASAANTLEFATNASATRNLANHVRLSWDYPSYVLSTFNIYRDNVLLTTLPTESRVYIDNAAVAGTTHFYQVEAVNGSSISQKVGAQGRLRSIRELNGMVYSNTDKYGVPNVDVYVTATGFTGHTKTDSSGFYVFSGLPETAGTSLTVFVDGYGTNHTTTFAPATQNFAIATSTTVYTRNFGSSYNPAITDTLAPTRPMNIIATPNPARRSVSVTWTASNTYYDGFEVYRANVLLANVKKGENLVAYDTAGYPGISYTYQIRSYQYTSGANKYSTFYSTTGTYPVLEAPVYLTATPNLALNNLRLTWSHNWDNHTRYEIRRNDSLLASANTKSLLEYIDNTGVPGQQYVYTVTSVMVVGNKTHYSQVASVSVQYPTVAEASAFAATIPTLSTSYATPCATNVAQDRNVVELNWTYNDNAQVKGFRVYRDQTLLATIPKTGVGVWANALDFNGSTNWVQLGSPAALNTFSNAITLEAWIRPTAYPNGVGSSILAKQDANGFGWSLKFQGHGSFAFATNLNGTPYYANTPQTNIPLNQWTHVAGVYDGAFLKLYLNGVLVTTVSQVGTMNNTGTWIAIGATNNWGEYFSGAIDEVRVWNVARTAAEIQTGLKASISTSATGLVAYYPFDQGVAGGANGTITSAIDVKGGNNGTLNNFALTGYNSNWIAHNGFVYRDYEGIPSNLTPYTVKTILEREGSNYYSQGVTLNKIYPNLATPQTVTHKDTLGMKQIRWAYPDGGATGFYIVRGTTVIDTLVADSMSQTQFVYRDKSGVSGTSYNYTIKTYSKRNGVSYFANDYTCLTGLVYPKPVTPTNLVATDGTYPSYTKVSWDYPQGTDVTGMAIFRNGTQIGTVAGGIKNYFDLTATGTASYTVRAYKTASFQGNAYTNYSDFSNADNGYPSQANITNAFSMTTLTATTGTLNGQTRLDWTYPTASNGSITGFKVYRDGQLLQNSAATDRYFFDANGIAGKHYIYEVCTFLNTIEYNRKAAEGWSKADGYLEGKVVVAGNGGVGGVSIQAVATIDGNDYIYNAVSSTTGDYAIPNVYYGDAITSFKLTAKYGDHVFMTNPIFTTLSPQQKSRTTLYFQDQTAYTISGTVGRREASCNLDSIHIYAEYIMADSSVQRVMQDAYTTPEGKYSITVNPYTLNAIGLRVHIDDTRLILTKNGADTLHFAFKAMQTKEFASLENFAQSTLLNFEDTLTYPARLSILTACGSGVLGGNFKIRVRSKDDCFDKIFTTDLTGKVTANLPPLSYTMYVDGVANNTSANQLVVDYLRYRPQELDLYSHYAGNEYYENAQYWDSLSQQQFIYHRPPTISILSGFNRYLCDNPTQPAIIKQGTKYSIQFQVEETFNNQPCISKTGFIVIKNAASTKNIDTVYLSPTTGAAEVYKFTAGNPNLVSPHRYTVALEYRSDLGELIATKNMAVIVEGSAALPGADIIVDLGNGTVQLPIFTLRDPYGDGSSSTIAEGSSITKNFSIKSDIAFSGGLALDLNVTAIAGVALQLNLNGTEGSGESMEYSLTATTTQEISTSSDAISINVGPKADVIVGAGMALQYGLVQEIKVADCSNITKVQRLGFSPHSVKTTWYYTVAQIEALVKEYTNKIVQVDAGTLVLEEKGQVLSKAVAKSRLETYKNNWEQVLVYHNKETLPWYNLCQKKAEAVPEPYKSVANAWRSGFCAKAGSYDGNGDFQPKDNLVWDQELVTAYNNCMSAIRNVQQNYLTLPIQELPNWNYTPQALSDPAKYVDEAYVNLHGLQAENITFGSGVTVTKSFESAAASTTTFNTSSAFSFDMGVGFALDMEAFAGWIAELKTVRGALTILGTFGFEIISETSQSNAVENTNMISYTLKDDDDYDQFSVTAIQGIDPHQTPYFSLLGGRSSCPYEEGTIARDDFSISIYDPETQSTSKSVEIYDVPKDESAVIYVQIANNNPFGEKRSLGLYSSRLYNPEGAVISVYGDVLWEASIVNLPVNEPTLVAVTIGRGPVAYDYENLKLFVRTLCSESVIMPEKGDTVTINIHFKNECSPIAIAEPDGYWTILKQNVNDPNSREVLPIRLMDYDPSNENLLDVHLEYRRKGNGLTWHQIPSSELSPALLGDWNDENFLASQVPYYMYSWDITGDYVTYPDGEYEVRAVADCGLGGRVYSNIIKGAIERKTNLYGLPQPSDKVWTVGDEISVAFNLDIDCATIADSNFIVQKYGDNTTILPGTVNCANNKLIFNPELSLMQYFDGDTLEMVVGGVRTFNGNLLDTVCWQFVVISRDLYVTNDSLSVELTQGQTADLGTTLVNNIRTGEVLNYHIQNLAGAASWLSSADSTGTVAFNSPKNISFRINSKEMPIGTTTLNLDIFANGRLYENAIKVSVKVLPKGPDWDFDPSQYSQDMTLVANYNFNNTGVKSTDTTDLISVWIDNKLRGVANINKFTSTLHSAVISVYGNPSDFGKALKFRIWDASAGIEYDARPDANAVISFAPDKIEGSVSSPRLLDVFTASDKVQYIPLNQGWTMFSVNTNRWNAPLNTAIASLRHPHDGDVIKTANKSAEYVSASNSWVSTNGLDSTNVHRGYQIYLQAADTLRITGSAAAISPISLNYGWNFVGYPPQTALGIDTAFTFLGQPDSVTLKTTAQNPTYSRNMVAIYDNSTWKYTSNSDMDMLYPNFAYKMRVNTIGSQLYFEGANASQAPVTLLRTVQETPLNLNKPEEWAVNAPSFEHNMLITGVIDYNKAENVNGNSKIAAYVGKECRGVGELVYVKELKRYVTTMMVYSNGGEEEISFYIYNADQNRSYKHHETLTFTPDALIGNYSSPYHFSNVAPDNTFNGSVYPNPFIDGFEVNLKSDKTQDYEIQLLDLTGRVLKKISVSSDKESFSTSIDTEALDLVEGVYLLQVKGSLGKTLTFKVIHAKQ